MINRAKMPRQLRNKGGITSVVPRTNYLFGGIKRRIRKLIPNELASVAVKAAPIVAPFNPGAAALMRGIGRFDQRGSISDALKQGIGTFAFGKGVGKLGGAQSGDGFFGGQTYTRAGFDQGPIGSLFNRQAANKEVFGSGDALGGEMLTTGDKPSLLSKAGDVLKKGIKALPKGIEGQLIAGGLTAGASLLASYFQGEFEEPEPGESMEEYLARRREYVGTQMRTYMDNYFANDPEYMKLDDAGRDAFVARYNIRDGGRVGYQTGGITMANTLAENIRRNLANQAAFNQMIRPAQLRALKITPIKTRPIETKPIKTRPIETKPIETKPIETRPIEIKPIETRPIEIRDLNLNRNPALDLLNQPQQPQFLKNINQTGMPRAITQEDIDTFNFAPPALPIGIQSLAELDAIRNRVLAAQAAMKPTYQEALMGESWETLSDNDQYRLAMEYPGETPPRRNPDFVPNVDAGLSGQEIAEKYNIPYAKGGRVKFDEGADKKRQMIKDMLERGADDDTIMTITGATQEEIDQIKNSKAKGGMPVGIMRTNKAGIKERDYRETGGFVPVGIKEKADDVPAMLSKNEFVFTADAVRGAGNGSIERGAQKMYDTMKRLEKRVV